MCISAGRAMTTETGSIVGSLEAVIGINSEVGTEFLAADFPAGFVKAIHEAVDNNIIALLG